MDRSNFSLGFSCRWYKPDPRPTWSYTPWNLRLELAKLVDVRDVGPELTAASETFLKLSHLRLEDRKLASSWAQSRQARKWFRRDVERRIRSDEPDAIIQMMDYTPVRDRPSFIYQDLSRGLILDRFGRDLPAAAEFNSLHYDDLKAGLEHQLEVYESSDVIFCMSHWLASSLMEQGFSGEKLKVVNPGINAHLFSTPSAKPRPGGVPRRLIIVGRDLVRKGLRDVLEAMPLVLDVLPRTTLTAIGPAVWPLKGGPPSYVDFQGTLTSENVALAMAQHDLLVMPSRWEGFGIVFAEALIAGLPCVGKNDCAMPEIIEAPRFGRVVGSPGEEIEPSELAGAIVACLQDDGLASRVAGAHRELSQRYSWHGAAEAMTSVISEHL